MVRRGYARPLQRLTGGHDMLEGRHRRVTGRIARGVVVVAALALAATACSDVARGCCDAGTTRSRRRTRSSRSPTLTADAAGAEFEVQPSVEQVAVTGAEPEVDLVLYDQSGSAAALGTTDEQGSLVFRTVDAGPGLPGRHRGRPGRPRRRAGRLRPDRRRRDRGIHAASSPSTTTRRWSRASTTSRPATAPRCRRRSTCRGPVEDGPYPTVVEYSGLLAVQAGREPDRGALGRALQDACPRA